MPLPPRKTRTAATEQAARRGMSVGDLFDSQGVQYKVTALGHQLLLAMPVDTDKEVAFYDLEHITYPIPTVSAVQITIAPNDARNGIEVLTQHIMSDGSQRDVAVRYPGTISATIIDEVRDALAGGVLIPLLTQVRR